MPEGDTIFRTAAGLTRALVGRTVTRFETGYAQLSAVDDDTPIAGQRIESVRALGKHLLMRFSGGLTLRTHMRMSGSWHIYRPGERWQRPRHEMRIVIETDAFVAVAFLVPVAEFLDDRALARSPTLRRLGPDLLSPDFDAGEAVRRLRAQGDRPLGLVVMDQSVMAGAGNVYRSETLFLCGVSPQRPARDVPDETLAALVATARRLMQANVGPSARGSVIPATYQGLRGTTRRSDQGERLWVYDRRGLPCRRCGTPIRYQKLGLEARGVYFCTQCQR
jgi:endonuclease VIII